MDKFNSIQEPLHKQTEFRQCKTWETVFFVNHRKEEILLNSFDETLRYCANSKHFKQI